MAIGEVLARCDGERRGHGGDALPVRRVVCGGFGVQFSHGEWTVACR